MVRKLLEKGREELLQEYMRQETKIGNFSVIRREKRRMMPGSGWRKQEMKLLPLQQGRNQGRRKRKGNLSVMRKQKWLWLVHQQYTNKSRPTKRHQLERKRRRLPRSILQKIWRKQKTKSQQQNKGQCNHKRQSYCDI